MLSQRLELGVLRLMHSLVARFAMLGLEPARRSVNDRLRHLACIPTPGLHLETQLGTKHDDLGVSARVFRYV